MRISNFNERERERERESVCVCACIHMTCGIMKCLHVHRICSRIGHYVSLLVLQCTYVVGSNLTERVKKIRNKLPAK